MSGAKLPTAVLSESLRVGDSIYLGGAAGGTAKWWRILELAPYTGPHDFIHAVAVCDHGKVTTHKGEHWEVLR